MPLAIAISEIVFIVHDRDRAATVRADRLQSSPRSSCSTPRSWSTANTVVEKPAIVEGERVSIRMSATTTSDARRAATRDQRSIPPEWNPGSSAPGRAAAGAPASSHQHHHASRYPRDSVSRAMMLARRLRRHVGIPASRDQSIAAARFRAASVDVSDPATKGIRYFTTDLPINRPGRDSARISLEKDHG